MAALDHGIMVPFIIGKAGFKDGCIVAITLPCFPLRSLSFWRSDKKAVEALGRRVAVIIAGSLSPSYQGCPAGTILSGRNTTGK